MPVLVHGDVVVTLVAAICANLAAAFSAAGLAPHPQERADYFHWRFFAAGPVETVVKARALGLVAPPEKRGTVGYDDFDTVMTTLEGKLAVTDYMAGGRYTAADIYVGLQVIWGLMFETIPSRPAFRDYRKRLMARPACRRANGLA